MRVQVCVGVLTAVMVSAQALAASPNCITSAGEVAGAALSMSDIAVGPLDQVYAVDGAKGHLYRQSDNGIFYAVIGGDRGQVDGPFNEAKLMGAYGLAGTDTRVYIADTLGHAIRVMESDNIYTLAGTRERGLVDGAGASARFSHPYDLAVAPDGTIYVADTTNHAIRAITHNANFTDVQVTTVVGGSAGMMDGDVSLAKLKHPVAVGVLPDGDLLVADRGNSRIRRVRPGGAVETWIGGEYGYGLGRGTEAPLGYVSGLAIAPDGYVYVTDRVIPGVLSISPQGDVIPLTATDRGGVGSASSGFASDHHMLTPSGLTVRGDGAILVAELLPARLRVLDQCEGGGVMSSACAGAACVSDMNTCGVDSYCSGGAGIDCASCDAEAGECPNNCDEEGPAPVDCMTCDPGEAWSFVADNSSNGNGTPWTKTHTQLSSPSYNSPTALWSNHTEVCPSETKPCWAPATYHNYEMRVQYGFIKSGQSYTPLEEGDFVSLEYMSMGTYDNHLEIKAKSETTTVVGLMLKNDEANYTLYSESGKTTTSVPVRHGDGQGILFKVVQRAEGYFDAYIDNDLVLSDQYSGGQGFASGVHIYQDGGSGKWWDQVGGAVFNQLTVNRGSDCSHACFDTSEVNCMTCDQGEVTWLIADGAGNGHNGWSKQSFQLSPPSWNTPTSIRADYMETCPDLKPCYATGARHNYKVRAKHSFASTDTPFVDGDSVSIEYMSLGTYNNELILRAQTDTAKVIALKVLTNEATYRIESASGVTTTDVPVRHGDGEGIVFKVTQRQDGHFDAYIDNELVLSDQYIGGSGYAFQLWVEQTGGGGTLPDVMGGAVFNRLVVRRDSDCPHSCDW